MRSTAGVLLTAGFLLAPPSAAAPPEEAISALLSRGGLVLSDLGRSTSADLPGTPRVASSPYALPHLGPVLGQPLRLVPLAGSLRDAAARLSSDPGLLLFKLGIETRLGGSGPAAGGLPEEGDLALALDLLRRPLDAAPPFTGSFGSLRRAVAPDGPASERSARESASLPGPLRGPLARLALALADADAWVRLSWRRVPAGVAARAASSRGLLLDFPDGSSFPADLDDAARLLDAESLATGARIAVAAASRASGELGEALRSIPEEASRELRWEVETPRGRLLVAGTGPDRHAAKDPASGYFLVVDLGGDDTWEGAHAAALWPARPVSVALDLGGDDGWTAARGMPAQGSGCGGVGVLLDAGGDDRYSASDRAQGWGLLGAGVLLDAAGKDRYALESEGQGAALFGTGLLFDWNGDDVYTLLRDGQGYGGPGGAGLLVDLGGDDRYEAERDPATAGRPDARADGKVATSNAQGVGVGRRGDGSDGHSWPGGLGALLDLAGKDSYSAGTWAQGAGYFFGTGLLVDAGGADTYEATWYAQGSAAHRGLGLLLDEAGDDVHVLSGTGGAGLGFGWDFAAGLLVDRSGNDVYRARRLALGAATQRSAALFLDEGGDDRYELEVAAEGLGHVDDDPAWARRDPIQPAWNEAAQAGLFLDLGGRDEYPAGSRAADGATWGTFEMTPATRAPQNLGAGADRSPPPTN
ncbi:MAG: hypothetical protein EDX89_18445 [Acidobacteria bacterium]|nr:MAG: hypothetical protein EDX89_18445 [Acidobacteriota bacterium]